MKKFGDFISQGLSKNNLFWFADMLNLYDDVEKHDLISDFVRENGLAACNQPLSGLLAEKIRLGNIRLISDPEVSNFIGFTTMYVEELLMNDDGSECFRAYGYITIEDAGGNRKYATCRINVSSMMIDKTLTLEICRSSDIIYFYIDDEEEARFRAAYLVREEYDDCYL